MNDERSPYRIQPKQPSKSFHLSTSNLQLCSTLKCFLRLVRSSYGPYGMLKTLQNSSGGHVTVTSTSSRLFPLLTVSHPVLKIVNAALSGHIQTYSDGGLFAALLCTELVISSLDMQLNRRLLIDVYEYLLSVCVNYLNSDKCGCLLNIDFSKLDILLSVTRSVIQTKVGCFLSDSNLQHITQLVVEVFLQTLTDDQTPHVQYLCVEGCNPQSSRTLQGVLFQQLLRQDIGSVKWMVLPSGERYIKTALFNVSLSGDSEELIDVQYELHNMDENMDDVVVDNIVEIMKLLVKEGVGLVMCQKVIHPRVRQYLQGQKVIIIDRLGSLYTSDLQRLTGGLCLSSISSVSSMTDLGMLTGLNYVDIGRKMYLHLQNHHSPVHTVVLCNRHEECLQEMKVAAKSALLTLRLLLTRPAVLHGGGCWQTHLASYIRQWVSQNTKDIILDLQCSEFQLMTAANNFVHSIEKVAMATCVTNDEVHQIDNLHWHHWTDTSATCCCGYVTRHKQMTFKCISLAARHTFEGSEDGNRHMIKNLIVDSLPVRLNGLQVGVNAANVVLGIANVIVSKD